MQTTSSWQSPLKKPILSRLRDGALANQCSGAVDGWFLPITGQNTRMEGTLRFILILCAVALLTPARAAAQPGPIPEWPIAPGSRVRILSPVLGDKAKTGTVVSSTSDTIFFRPAKQATATALGTPSIVKIEVARGKHTHTKQGVLIGLTLGALGGAVLASATYKNNCPTSCLVIMGKGSTAVIGGLLGGFVGTFVGGMLGSRPIDTWVSVSVPQR